MSPDTATINVGKTQQFTATGTFSDGSTKILGWSTKASMPTAREWAATAAVNGHRQSGVGQHLPDRHHDRDDHGHRRGREYQHQDLHRAVLSPAQMTSNLITDTDSLNFQQGASLLQNALNNLNSGNTGATCNQLNALINQVQAQSGKTLTMAQANQLIADATQIKTAIGCP